ncbi:alpha/beta hydrolase [Bacillus sp. M6-12]|uniref:alpha/beta fold hydrolase n=1 Tax=Bacillus sp. M6-12 TaxID=2054166 RepID=UPI000C77D1E4|nr:alpha/beta hydrolase [Bacillus sp. M6-12]PLS15366.1 alpha/beta hydrolase [Bacillus sp. M6-12]
MGTIYKTEEGKSRLAEYYETYTKSLKIPFERDFVETTFGRTHVLVTGPKDGKPLFILQGGNCINPMTLSWFSSLLDTYRVYSPDTIGHPGLSSENRTSAKDESFALWISDLMDYYQIESAAFAGPSHGGGIILLLAAHIPERIACSLLFAPAGIVLNSKREMIKRILIPLLLYKWNGSAKHLKKITDAMSLNSMKPLDAAIIGEIFRSVKLEKEMPKIANKADLENYAAPTMVIGCKEDVFFPGEKLTQRASEIFPHLPVCNLYNCGHFSNSETLAEINSDMKAFLENYYR